MKPREITLLSLMFCLDILTQVTGLKVIASYILVYVIAFLVFIYLPDPTKFLLLVLIFETSIKILEMMMSYWYWIAMIEAICRMYGIVMRPDKVFLMTLIFIPFQNITQLYLARHTVRKLRLRERVGKF